MIKNTLKINKKNAFSLAEVLVSLLIISVILLLALPVITKKGNFANNSKKGGSQVFLFQQQSEEDANFPCYVTNTDASGTTIVKQATGKCQRYTFTVPNNVYKMDLTLVAGGGGGGGAAGGTIFKKEYTSQATSSLKLLHSRIQKFVINTLVSSGADGKQRDKTTNSTIYAGNGGASGSAIINHTLPLNFLTLDYTPNFLSETAAQNSSMTMKFGDEHILFDNLLNKQAKKCVEWNTAHSACLSYSTENLYDINSYAGYGLLFESDKTVTLEQGSGWEEWLVGSNVDTKSKASVFVPSKQGSGNEIQCFTTNLDEVDGKYTWSSNSANITNIASASVDSSIEPNSAIASSLCKLSSLSFIPSNAGKTSYLSPSNITDKVSNGYLVQGGEGGRVFGLGNYGAGGRGEGAQILCENNSAFCSLPNNSQDTSTVSAINVARIKTIEAEKNLNNQYGKVSAYINNPGGVGSGGAGGSVIKIKDFPTTPGAKYTIVVGAGGAGGNQGSDGIISSSSGSYIKTPTVGNNGTGGSSSAIYDENNKLILLVIGGVGGYGGNINTNAQTIPSGDDLSNYAPLSNMPQSARNVPLVLSSSVNYIDEIIPLLDTNITSSIETTNSSTPNEVASGLVARRIVNRFMMYDNNNKRKSPYFELNKNSLNVSQGIAVTNAQASDDYKTGGFNNFDNNLSRTLNDVSSKASIVHNGLNKNTSAYRGLYFRSVIGNTYSYAGGLGGFSGLGTKAGCGGLFVGNNNGILSDGGYNNAYKNTFMINTAASGENFIPYNINNYYGNCTVSNSNGQTAEFVAPSYVSSAGEKLGSAGSGGGGGGYSSKYGAGKGGSGQNGYVMINWRY